eukprot:4661879-Pyramimonas_sp.AAC.1
MRLELLNDGLDRRPVDGLDHNSGLGEIGMKTTREARAGVGQEIFSHGDSCSTRGGPCGVSLKAFSSLLEKGDEGPRGPKGGGEIVGDQSNHREVPVSTVLHSLEELRPLRKCLKRPPNEGGKILN